MSDDHIADSEEFLQFPPEQERQMCRRCGVESRQIGPEGLCFQCKSLHPKPPHVRPFTCTVCGGRWSVPLYRGLCPGCCDRLRCGKLHEIPAQKPPYTDQYNRACDGCGKMMTVGGGCVGVLCGDCWAKSNPVKSSEEETSGTFALCLFGVACSLTGFGIGIGFPFASLPKLSAVPTGVWVGLGIAGYLLGAMLTVYLFGRIVGRKDGPTTGDFESVVLLGAIFWPLALLVSLGCFMFEAGRKHRKDK